jgi:hypothetical protein
MHRSKAHTPHTRLTLMILESIYAVSIVVAPPPAAPRLQPRGATVTASTVVTCAAGFASTADTCFASTVATGTTAAADSCSVCRRRRRGAASAAASEVTTAPGREALAPRPPGDASGDPGDLSGDASGDLLGDPEGHRRDTARRHLAWARVAPGGRPNFVA